MKRIPLRMTVTLEDNLDPEPGEPDVRVEVSGEPDWPSPLTPEQCALAEQSGAYQAVTVMLAALQAVAGETTLETRP